MTGVDDRTPAADPHRIPDLRTTLPRLDHAAIGNGRVLALIAPDSSLEWLCLPRFDSPSLFGALLDPERGGVFRFLVNGAPRAASQMDYVPNTNVLRSRFESGDARWEIIDFAPRTLGSGGQLDVPHELVRLIRPLAGIPRLVIDFRPRPDYGRAGGELLVTPQGVEVRGTGMPLHLYTNVAGDRICTPAEVSVREPLYFVLSCGHRRGAPTVAAIAHVLEETVRAWRLWAMTCALPSFAPTHVLRSALCLKLHTYVDTGAIIAAATTSLPEALDTERTYDDRHCWLRSAASTAEALRRLSHLHEGTQFISFVRDLAESAPLQPVYGIGGERQLSELTLHHLRGFAGSGPVRVGSAAATRQRNDLQGEVVLCLQAMLDDPRIELDRPDDLFGLLERLVEDAIRRAPEPDTSIWEFRTSPRHYTFSRAMCWVATTRGAKLATRFGRRDLAARWAKVAEAERRVVLGRGFSESARCFTQALDGVHGDAANLLLPSLGILDARDPRFAATLHDYGSRMTRLGLMRRYTNPDDLGSTSSAFMMCSFWWAEALALAGKLGDASAVFERAVRHANRLGLLSKNVDPETGHPLGNFPHVEAHVSLINAAITIGAFLDARDGRVRAWS
ncbi:MAG TPA: glycoside hydrolase family 15 protein [Kofleriaceae bacterium]|jgi:GH15 family glucan-1,4-alpha-glucosidase|nr:glycoside hydrolase family 15 protein [Kofleriaceae bacterium]